MNTATDNRKPESPAGFTPEHGSAWVYSGPHYGRKHKILRRTETLVWVEYRGDKFAVPHCDVEECK